MPTTDQTVTIVAYPTTKEQVITYALATAYSVVVTGSILGTFALATWVWNKSNERRARKAQSTK